MSEEQQTMPRQWQSPIEQIARLLVQRTSFLCKLDVVNPGNLVYESIEWQIDRFTKDVIGLLYETRNELPFDVMFETLVKLGLEPQLITDEHGHLALALECQGESGTWTHDEERNGLPDQDNEFNLTFTVTVSRSWFRKTAQEAIVVAINFLYEQQDVC